MSALTIITRQMVAAAWDWAKSRNLVRVNPIHKEEEAKLILSDTFEISTETGSETKMQGTVEVEDIRIISVQTLSMQDIRRKPPHYKTTYAAHAG